jgi:predicted  nucleic acid-binding Zn-ribbon protein|tara:strand:- start:538 stop:729 length:192 start_codon:yes stop_codon:yes gene_type:complete
MEQRVRKLETDVAVLGNRQDTAEAEISSIREDVKEIRSDIAKAQGLIIAVTVISQIIGILMVQ